MRSESEIALIKTSLGLLADSRRLPFCYGVVHFIAGVGFLLLVLSAGFPPTIEIPVTFGAIFILCVASVIQILLFMVLYFKNAPLHFELAILVLSLRRIRPYLVIALVFPAMVMVLFLVTVVLSVIKISNDPQGASFIPEYYSIGFGVSVVVFEVFPMLVHHDLMVRIGRILKFYQEMQSYLPSISNSNLYQYDNKRLTVYEFLNEENRYGSQDALRMVTLHPPPPPSYMACLDNNGTIKLSVSPDAAMIVDRNFDPIK